MKKHREYEIIEESNYKKGLAIQREQFKLGKNGSGQNNYDQMCDAVENLKSDLKSKMLKQGNRETVQLIEKIIDWYRTLEQRYSKNTPEGIMVVFPSNIDQKINKNLTIAYEKLIGQMEILDLL